jgi:TPR repeat protein
MKTKLILLLNLLLIIVQYSNAHIQKDSVSNHNERSLTPKIETSPVETVPKVPLIGRRCALVIGNNEYINVSKLTNAINDADDISAALKRMHFEVTTLKNVNYESLTKSLSDFKARTKDAEIILIYYAGHGMTYDAMSHLLPINVPHTNCVEEMLKYSISTNSILEGLDNSSTQVKLIFLDACRNKLPLSPCEKTPPKLSAQLRNNTAIVYATDDGTTANDGISRNGLFTGCLLKFIEIPNMEVKSMIAKTIGEAQMVSSNKQVPNSTMNISIDVVLNPISLSNEEVKDILKQSDIAYEQSKYPETFRLLTPYVNHPLFDANHARKLGFLYETGLGSTQTQSFTEAIKYYTIAANKNDSYSQFCLGLFYEKGKGTSQNIELSKEWYKRATAEKGTTIQPCAFYNLALINEKEGKYDDAIREYFEAAELELVDAQVNLGMFYELGKGVIKNTAEALKWYKRAADQNDKDGLFNYARLGYQLGAISATDVVPLYQKAAKEGHIEACINLAFCLETGKGDVIDIEKAKYWYELAAAKDHPIAWLNLGILAESTANNHQPNYVEAINRYEKAAKLNIPEALHNLGIIYEKANGTKKDMQKAKQYYQKAAELGFKDSKTHLANLASIGR